MLTGDKDHDIKFKFEMAMDRLTPNFQQWVNEYIDWRVANAVEEVKQQPRESSFTGRIDNDGGKKTR